MTLPVKSKLNILLVEDDSDDILFFKEAVEELDIVIELTIASDCRELFNQFSLNKDFDIIFLDINLPIRDGKECLKEIKLNERYKDIPIIIFTGSNAQPDVDEVYKNGAHFHVVKPYAQSNYIAALKIVLALNWKEKQPRPAREDFVINLTYN